MRLLCACCLSSLFLVSAANGVDVTERPTALKDYVEREEPKFDWTLVGRHPTEFGVVYDLELTSQEWHGIVWKHVLQVYEPVKVAHPKHMLLLVSGGANGRRPDEGDMRQGLELAKLCGARVATLHQVPNQPLFGGRVEDDLITETWLRYLKSGDETWPLLFPMVKSAVAAMDALEQCAEKHLDTSIDGFVITGGSKRGWTSWLTPVVDKRVIATAPIVIDVLNFRPQMKHQLEAWGKYSEQIFDYTSKGLIKEGEESPREARLRRMVDPYTYRSVLSLPKLLVNGTNDPYWVVDAMQFYWNDLIGPKYVLQVPNAGHGLKGGRELAFSTVAAFFRHAATATPMPSLEWENGNGEGGLTLKIRSNKTPKAARLWTATSGTRDFRESTWKPRPLPKNGSGYEISFNKPKAGHIAYYGELQFDYHGLPYSLCTTVKVE